MTALFECLLGEAFDTLPAPVRALHRTEGARRYRGEVEVERGSHPLAMLCAVATRLPPTGRGPIEVLIVADDRGESWQRRFSRHAMRSRLTARDGALNERLGLATFVFALAVRDGGIEYRVRAVRVFGVPLPSRWFAGVTAREDAQDGRYRFDVRAALPRAGLLVRYRGVLDVG